MKEWVQNYNMKLDGENKRKKFKIKFEKSSFQITGWKLANNKGLQIYSTYVFFAVIVRWELHVFFHK